MAVVNAISYMRPTQLQRVLISALIRPCLPKGGRIYICVSRRSYRECTFTARLCSSLLLSFPLDVKQQHIILSSGCGCAQAAERHPTKSLRYRTRSLYTESAPRCSDFCPQEEMEKTRLQTLSNGPCNVASLMVIE